VDGDIAEKHLGKVELSPKEREKWWQQARWSCCDCSHVEVWEAKSRVSLTRSGPRTTLGRKRHNSGRINTSCSLMCSWQWWFM